MRGQEREAGLFQADIVIVAEIVDTHHGIAAQQQGMANGGTDKSRRACDQFVARKMPA